MNILLKRLWSALARFFLRLAGSSTDPNKEDAENPVVVVHPHELDPVNADINLRFSGGFAIDEASRGLELERQGRERGLQELPASDSTTLDAIELDILEWANAQARRVRYEWERALDGEVARNAAHINLEIQNVLADARADEATLRAEGRAPDNARGLLFTSAQDAKRAFLKFKLDNGLDREARYANSRVRRTALAIGVMVLLETIANSTVFSIGLAGGYSQGALLAITFAALNTIAGFLFGLAAREIFHRRQIRKLAGFGLLLVAILWGTALNFAVAQFRDALAANPDNGFSAVMAMLRERPFAITNFLSAILLVIGGVFYTLSFLEGLLFYDDPYPGYGRIDRRYKDAVTDFQLETRDALGRLIKSKDEKLHRIRGEIARVQGLIAYHSQKVSQAERDQARFRAFVHELEGFTGRLAQIYRDANRQTRKTPTPAHFASPLRLDGAAVNEMPLPSDEGFATEQLSRCTDQIVNAFDELQRSFPTVEEL